MLQVNEALITELHSKNFEIAIETNGTLKVLEEIDWICVSPKAGADLVQKSGDELKLIYPQTTLKPEIFEDLAFRNFYLQPMDGDLRVSNTQKAVEYCKSNPKWKLSIQTHKLIGIP